MEAMERQPPEFRVGSKRNRAETVVLDGVSPEKRPKTTADCSLLRQCSGLLKELMKTLTSDAASADGVSTSKQALHVAMAKSQLADIIFEVQKRITKLINDGEKADSMKMEQEKRRFRQRLLEDKEKIEAQLMETNVELKKQRERDRKAAQIVLERMENTAGIESNVEIELSGFSVSTAGNPLHKLGLFLRDEDLEFQDIEEGEIV